MSDRRLRVLVVVGVLDATACRHVAGIDDPVLWDANRADGTHGTDGSDGASGFCYGTGIVQVCFGSRPTGMVTLPSVDTDTSTLCSTDVTSGPAGVCVVAAQTIVIPSGATSVAMGSKPLVLVADDQILVAGKLDAASHLTGARGAGSSSGTCNMAPAPSGGGGGAGGSFGGRGGSGGGPGVTTAGAVVAATSLRGGCAGRDGTGSSGAGGDGGGAVFLIAAARIDVSGSVNASGAGADKADGGFHGGSGGGSGGMIGLDAPTVTVAGIVFANGGGGSGGSDSAAESNEGNDPPLTGAAASGGSGGGTAGNGGNGAAGSTLDGSSGTSGVAGSSGGGGGGGGAGVIKLYGTRSGAGTISPPPS